MDAFVTLLTSIVHKLTTFDYLLGFASYVSAVFGALIAFLTRRDNTQPRTIAGFVRYCLPRKILTSHSAFLDVSYALVRRFVSPLLRAPFIVGTIGIAFGFHALLVTVFGAHPPSGPTPWYLVAVCAVALIFAEDIANFFPHFFYHKVQFLWEFHKVHHSAEYLTPLTNRRFHPVQDFLDDLMIAVLRGTCLGSFAYGFGMDLAEVTVYGIDVYFFVTLLCFYQLRHSHIPMSFGWLERYIMSPAQHQIHHSSEERHLDSNFGLLFSFWDRMAGTLRYSEPVHDFRLGLVNDEHREYSSVVRLYWLPVKKVALRLWLAVSPRRVGDHLAG